MCYYTCYSAFIRGLISSQECIIHKSTMILDTLNQRDTSQDGGKQYINQQWYLLWYNRRDVNKLLDLLLFMKNSFLSIDCEVPINEEASLL